MLVAGDLPLFQVPRTLRLGVGLFARCAGVYLAALTVITVTVELIFTARVARNFSSVSKWNLSALINRLLRV